MKEFYIKRIAELEEMTLTPQIEEDINNYNLMLNSAKHKEKARQLELERMKIDVVNEKAPEGCEGGACVI